MPKEKILKGEAVAIRCAHGDTALYPVAQVQAEVGGQVVEVEAAVSATLPMSMLLGTDVPELSALLKEKQGKAVEESVAVCTRAWPRDQEQEQEVLEQRQPRLVDQLPLLSEEPLGMPLPPFADDVFVLGRSKIRLTRREKRAGRRRHQAEQQAELEATGQQGGPEGGTEAEAVEQQPIEAQGLLDIAPTKLHKLQESDSSLGEAQVLASWAEPGTAPGYFWRGGLLYRN